MKLKYSLSHLMLLFVIVGLICLWNIQRKKIDSLTEKLNQTTAALQMVKMSVALGTYNMTQSITPEITHWREYNSNSIEDLRFKCKEHAGMLEYVANGLELMKKNVESVEVK